ncbi:hypothetical protein IH922_05130, partial [candidate division KSB1 bacterium]|nr:hypothetical protein [candidate division KSB1 bacterium]
MTTKTKSTFILLGVLAMGVTIGALASGTLQQQRKNRFERMPPHERFFSFMKSVVEPSEEQRDAVERIIENRSEQLRELHETHQTGVIAIYDALRADLQTLLTDEQKKRFEEQIVKGSHKIAESRIERLTEALDLNDDQQKRIEEILAKFKKLPRPERKGSRGNWEDRRKMMRNQFQELHEEIEAVLTPEQKEKFGELRRHRSRLFDGRPGP